VSDPSSPPRTREKRPARRVLSVLCVVYALLLVYASLMPFDLTASPDWHDRQLARLSQYWPFGPQRASRADMLSNLVLYVPLGLLAATRLTLGNNRSRALAALAATAVCAGVSLLIECGQVFSLSRVASATDLLMNAVGGAAGAVTGALWGADGWRRVTSDIRRLRVERPTPVLVVLMLLLLAADALYPLRPTLDLSTIARNVRNSTVAPSEGFARHRWHHWVVTRVGVYAVLTVLLGASGRRRTVPWWVSAALIACGFATVSEVGKLFIVSRAANVANVLASAGGALVGLLCGLLLSHRLRPVTRRTAAVVLLSAYIVYLAWTPFTFTWRVDAVSARMPRGAAWLPLYHYAMGGPQKGANAIRLFVRTLALIGALTVAAAMRWPRLYRGAGRGSLLVTALAMGLVGLILEFGQFYLPGRIPSTTDVFCFALGGALGVWVIRRYPSEPAAYVNSQDAEADSTSR